MAAGEEIDDHTYLLGLCRTRTREQQHEISKARTTRNTQETGLICLRSGTRVPGRCAGDKIRSEILAELCIARLLLTVDHNPPTRERPRQQRCNLEAGRHLSLAVQRSTDCPEGRKTKNT